MSQPSGNLRWMDVAMSGMFLRMQMLQTDEWVNSDGAFSQFAIFFNNPTQLRS